MSDFNENSLSEKTNDSVESISFNSLTVNSESKRSGVVGSFETCGGVMMKPGWNILNITDLPTNINSVSVWMTEGDSIARGGFASTTSVQLDTENKLVRIKYHWSWKNAGKAGAQCFWNFR